jgi:WD40 repeat protein
MKRIGILPPHQAVQLQPRRPSDLERSARTNWEAHWIAVAPLTILCLALAAAGCKPTTQSSSSASQSRPVVQTWHSASVNSVAFSPDRKTLSSSSEDHTIKLWDVSTGTELRTLKGDSAVFSVAFSSDGKTLASGGWDHTVMVWDVSTGTELRTLKGHSDVVVSVAFSPDGKTFASGS